MTVHVEYERPITNPIKEVKAYCTIAPADHLIVSDCSGSNIWFGVKYGPSKTYPEPENMEFTHPGVSLSLSDARELHTLLGRMLDHAKA